MKRILCLAVLAPLGAIYALGCGDPNNLTGELGDHDGSGSDPADNASAAGLTCTKAPEGRAYALLDSEKLAERANENVGVNRARVKPFAAMEKEFQRVLGVVPASLKDAAGSFDVPQARWYGEPDYSAVSLHAMSEISFEGCLAYTKTSAAFAAAPTADSARAECAKLMRKAWSRSPSPEEIAGCVDLATTKLADEKVVGRRWAYVCASVLSSTQFLTF